MKVRNLLVRIPYYNYEPNRIIVGIRPAGVHDVREPGRVIEELHARQHGWATLALCEQNPVGFWRGNTLRTIATMPGTAAPVEDVQGWLG